MPAPPLTRTAQTSIVVVIAPAIVKESNFEFLEAAVVASLSSVVVN